MYLHIATILFLILENINKVFTQGMPISPCQKIFQYRFDGFEWFGIVSVRNPDFGQPLHLRITLSLRGKPTTNYLGEIELLTRGQYLSDAPVLYKIKFPKSHIPPKLLQITTNNQVICFGKPDHGIFLTQIQLEHTRKFTFLPEGILPPSHASSTSSSFIPATEAMGLGGGNSAEMEDISILPANVAFDGKHLPLPNREINPTSRFKDVCGTIDARIRFQVSHAIKQAKASMDSSSPIMAFKTQTDTADSLLLSTLLSRQSDDISKGGKGAKAMEEEKSNENDDKSLPLLITSDSFLEEDSTVTDELPSIPRGAWPWLAAVYVNNLTSLAYQCGGTLVSSHVVVSAAHCFHLFNQRYTANEVLVFLGRHNLKNWNEEGSLAAPVDDIFIHPEYNGQLSSFDADIAVMVLKNKVRFNTFIRPACIWSGATQQQYIEGEHGIVVGWGLGRLNTTSSSNPVPKIISTPIVSNDVCFQANPKYYNLSSNRTFCAGVIPKKHSATIKNSAEGKPSSFHQLSYQGPCTGDSGAGLMIFKNNHWMLRGTVSGLLPVELSTDDSVTATGSKSSQTCTINQYVIYTDVAQFLDWIFAFML